MEKIKILIVDDEPLAREGVRVLLEQDPDVEVVGECANGREAVKALGELGPDLLFLDVQMPEMDGFEVLAQIEAARIMVRQAAATHDAKRSDKTLSSIAKLFASEMASRVGWDAIQILGGAGYTKDVCVERLVRDNKLCEIGEGSSEVQRMLISRAEYARRSA